MKKEIDTWKLAGLFDAFKKAALYFWYLFGFGLAAVLWFFPLPSTNIQAFAALGFLLVYSLLSVCLNKLEAIKQELK